MFLILLGPQEVGEEGRQEHGKENVGRESADRFRGFDGLLVISNVVGVYSACGLRGMVVYGLFGFGVCSAIVSSDQIDIGLGTKIAGELRDPIELTRELRATLNCPGFFRHF